MKLRDPLALAALSLTGAATVKAATESRYFPDDMG